MYWTNLLALPTTVILLLYVRPLSAENQWPHNVPRHLKYFPEDEEHARRSLDIQQRLMNEKPVGVKKASFADEGEMFMLDKLDICFRSAKRVGFG